MKKAVVILIAVIFIVAIALVNFFGVRYMSFDPVVYAQSIEILNTGLKEVQEEGETIKGAILMKDSNGERKYQILYKLSPDGVSKPGVNFNFDDQKDFVSITEDGLVTFSRPGDATITITPKDGSLCQAKIKITFIN